MIPNQEEWRPYNGKYEVSDLSRVRHIQRKHILAYSVSTNGYLQVGIGKSADVHKLVAAAFLGVRPEGYEIHHIDGNKKNPALSNLSYLPYLQHKSLIRKLERKPCPVCGKEIVYTRSTCSRACQHKYSRVERQCPVCGKAIIFYKSDITEKENDPKYHNGAKYCSQKCFGATRKGVPHLATPALVAVNG